MEWWYLAGGIIGGLLVGGLIGRFSGSSQRAELQQARNELEAYRGKVTQHFVRTAELVEVLAANSREIYQHLASGSEELCDADAVRLKNEALLKPLPQAAAGVATAAEVSAAADEVVAEPPAAEEAQEAAAAQAEEPKPAEAELRPVEGEPGQAAADEAPAEEPQPAKAAANAEWTEILPEAGGHPRSTARMH